MRSSRYHAGEPDPFQVLVEAGADREKLRRLLAHVYVGAAVEIEARRCAEGRRKKTPSRRVEEAGLKKSPDRLRELANEIEKLISNPEFDPRRYLPEENKVRFRDPISEKYSVVQALVSEWVNLPRSLYGFAHYLELRLGEPRSQSQPIRPGTTRRRAVIALRDYVQEATNRPHDEEVADLVTRVSNEAGLPGTLTADDLKKISQRYPSLRQPPAKFF